MGMKRRVWERWQIQPVLTHVVDNAVALMALPGDGDHRRRLVRSLLRMAARRTLARGGSIDVFVSLSLAAYQAEATELLQPQPVLDDQHY